MKLEHTKNKLRSLPPQERAQALRQQMEQRFGPRAVGFHRQQQQFRNPRAGRVRFASHFLAIAIVAAGLFLFRPDPALAGTLDLNLNVGSYHTEAWARSALNQVNPGLGLTWHASRTWAIAGGGYFNSYRRPTWYALGEWTPVQIGGADRWHLDAGLAGGLATGYRRDEVACEPIVGGAVVRIVAPDGIGLDLVAVPNEDAWHSGFIGIQIAVPLRRGRNAR